jgi:hypothetical protein
MILENFIFFLAKSIPKNIELIITPLLSIADVFGATAYSDSRPF